MKKIISNSHYFLIGIVLILVIFNIFLITYYVFFPINTDHNHLQIEENLNNFASNNLNLNQIKAQIQKKIMPNMQIIKEDPVPLKILFTGDIMLDRYVETLMHKKGYDYPFNKLTDFFNQADFVVANLEGPIVKNPPNTGAGSLQFSFDPKIIPILEQNNIQFVSLANNHTLNMSSKGLIETRQLLQPSKIQYYGDPVECKPEYYARQDDFIFLGFNKTYHFNCSNEQMATTVKEIQQSFPTEIIIITMHWGKEYSLTNTDNQQQCAHLLIEAGADAIIGHHPHVIENIEIYKNKPIFYSLGNCIFDQYFSENVQEGLIIELQKTSEELVYTIHPIKSELSQPFLLTGKEKQELLNKLAERSAAELQLSIQQGLITVDSGITVAP